MSFGGALNWSAQHSNLVAKMECGHEAAASHLLLCGPAIRDLGSLAGREPMSSIGRRFDRESSSVFSVISPTCSIRPPDRHCAKQPLSLSEREEISRWLSMRCSLRSIAHHLGRSPSTVSHEVQRNGGAGRYWAARSDQARWDRAAPEALQTGLPSVLEADSINLATARHTPRTGRVHPSG